MNKPQAITNASKHNTLPKEVALEKICVNENCFCASSTRGVIASARNPLKTGLSATSTLETPVILLTCSATYKELSYMIRHLLVGQRL